MQRLTSPALVLAIIMLTAAPALAQQALAAALAELTALSGKVGNTNTRIRVDAFHRVWSIALSSPDTKVKTMALGLLREPAGSGSDHVRMPAIFAIAEIANSTGDPQVKIQALESLAGPLNSSQVPIRDAAVDAVNSISRSAKGGGVPMAAVRALTPLVKSGVNGVRMPAINALVRAVEGREDVAASEAAVDLLTEPLKSNAAIGGMEVRMMAVVAMEKIGLDVDDVGAKAKAMGLLQTYATKDGWEPEAQKRAKEAATRIQASLKKP